MVMRLENEEVDLVVLVEHRAELSILYNLLLVRKRSQKPRNQTDLSPVFKPIDEFRSVTFHVMTVVTEFLLCDAIHRKLDVLHTTLKLRVVVTRQCGVANFEVLRLPILRRVVKQRLLEDAIF